MALISSTNTAQPGDDARFKVTPVILSGGTGARLWPLSRASFPKQFWPLATEHSLFQDAALRAMGEAFTKPIIVCNEEHRFLVAEQLRSIGISKAPIILEPFGRNSAPAITAAALLAAQSAPDTVLWMMAADAAIKNQKALQKALTDGYKAARAGYIVTFGVKPTSPHTGYGYIKVGAELPNLPNAHHVSCFLEKPELEAANAMLDSGGYLWNSGMFMFTAKTLLEEMQHHAPDVLNSVKSALAGCQKDLDFTRLDKAAFSNCPDISLDYAIAEHTKKAAVIPCDLGWSDVGSWSALWEINDKDEAGNVSHGDVILDKAENCYVRSDDMLTAVIGLKEAIIVTTEDAVLALHRDYAQDVKQIVETLKVSKRGVGSMHNRCYRPWGFYESLTLSERFQVKRIVVYPAGKLSLQKHFHRAEHWVVVAGTALVHRGGEDIVLRENESVYIPVGSVHRLENPGKIPLILIEVQVGSYLGEDDIIRLDDTYGRD